MADAGEQLFIKHKKIQTYWGEDEPISHYLDIFERAKPLFQAQVVYDQAVHNIGVLAETDATHIKPDGMHMQVPTAARAVVHLLSHAIEQGFHTGVVLTDQDKLAVITAAAAHDVLGQSNESSSAIGDIDIITSALQTKNNTPKTIKTTLKLIKHTDYKNKNNIWFQMGPHVPGQFMRLGDLTVQLPEVLVTSPDFIQGISNQFGMDPKFMMMAGVTVLADFFGIVTARRYPDIAREMYPYEVSPPTQIISLIDKLLYLQGVSPEVDNNLAIYPVGPDGLLTRYQNLRQERLMAN